jgi:hypothetical protein
MRIVAGVVVGLVVAFACIFAVEALDHMLFPLPLGLDLTRHEDQMRMMAAMPVAAKAIVVLGWFAASLLGGWAANLIARRALAGWIVGLLIVAGGIANMAMIAHPAWMWAGGILLPLAGAWLAQKLARLPF